MVIIKNRSLNVNSIVGQEIVNTESWIGGVYIATITVHGVKNYKALSFP